MPASRHTPATDLLAKKVVELRKKAGMNQRQLAAAVGREQNYIARVETAQRRLDLVEWVQLLRSLGVEPEAEILRIVRQVQPLINKPKKRT
jgi:transcriptional regulator with XRE-family HTH domain